MPLRNSIIKNQEYFFNLNAAKISLKSKKDIFYQYVNKEQIEGFKWIASSKTILEYGILDLSSISKRFIRSLFQFLIINPFYHIYRF